MSTSQVQGLGDSHFPDLTRQRFCRCHISRCDPGRSAPRRLAATPRQLNGTRSRGKRSDGDDDGTRPPPQVVFYVIPWDVSRGITKHTQNDVFYLSSAAAARNIRRRRNASTRRFPLFFLLAMRVQLCYNRWWEARSLWGLTISRSRNLARLAILYLPRQDRPRFCALIVAWAVAKKRHLRDERTMLLELADVLGPCDRRDAATAKHPPLWFLDALSRYVAETEAAGGMDSQQAQCFHDQHQWPSGC